MQKEIYYGLPQILWDNLCDTAEGLLQEDQLGVHLVAAYPAGNRIYGLESCPPGLFCLYVDSVEPILDPLSNYHNESGFHTFSSGTSYSPIIMADIYKWVQWVCGGNFDWRAKAFLHAIPFGRHVIHEDQSISEIMEAVFAAMQETYFTIPFVKHYEDKTFPHIVQNGFLYNRAMSTLYHTGNFLPNINPQWDEVADGPSLGFDMEKLDADGEFIKHDRAAREQILADNNAKGEAIQFLPKTLQSLPTRYISKKTLKRVSKTVMDLYRFQL